MAANIFEELIPFTDDVTLIIKTMNVAPRSTQEIIIQGRIKLVWF